MNYRDRLLETAPFADRERLEVLKKTAKSVAESSDERSTLAAIRKYEDAELALVRKQEDQILEHRDQVGEPELTADMVKQHQQLFQLDSNDIQGLTDLLWIEGHTPAQIYAILDSMNTEKSEIDR